MRKNTKRGYVVDAIILVVFCVIAFAVPFVKTAAFWTGFAFGVVAILLQLYFFYISFSKGEDAKSRFYGFPIAKIAVIYLIAQLLLSLLEMSFAWILPFWVALVINVLLIAFALIGSIAADMMREEIVHQDVQIKTDVKNMRAFQSLSASLVTMTQDEASKKLLQELADDFKYSDPVSSEDTSELENEIKIQLDELQKAILENDFASITSLATKTKAMLAERNRVCKLGK